MTSSLKNRWWLWAAVALTLAKLWLTRGQAIFAIGTAEHDDALFIKLADALVQGQWLGPYDQLTLAKGPFYSVWIAAMFLAGLPLAFARQLLYAGACALVVRALTPLRRNSAARFAAYAVLLWNPMSFEASTLGRVLRQHASSPLALLVFAGLIALYARRGEPFRRLAPWAALLGAAFAAFWLSREDGVWIIPSMALLGGAVIVGAFRGQPETWRVMARAGLLAAACAIVPVLAVCWQNARHYGWFGTVEFRASEFKDAYGALLRVRVGPSIPFVPVTRQTREAIYAVSPTFVQLRAHLDGPIGQGWAGASSHVTNLPAEELQIGGGWFMWALRDSVAAAGYCRNAREALAYYHRLALEVNRACDEGRLPAGPRRSGFMPPWRPGLTREWFRTAIDFADYLVSFHGFSAGTPASIGRDEDLLPFRDLTRDHLAPPPDALEQEMPRQAQIDSWKVATLQTIGQRLRPIFKWLVLAANLAALMRAGQLAWQRRLSYAFVLAAAAWGACATTILINALIQVTSFPVRSVAYLDAAYPLLLLFAITVLLDVAAEWRFPLVRRHRGQRTPEPVGKIAG